MKSTLTKNKKKVTLENTKSSGVRTKLITEPLDKLDQSTLLEHLFHVEAKDVTLKWVFDHLKNYLICGALFWVGLNGVKHSPSLLGIPYLNVIAGIPLAFSATVLLGLNFIHGIIGFSKIRNLKTVGIIGCVICSFLLCISALMLLLTAKST